MRIAEICSRDVACIDADASVRAAALEMRRRHVGCLVVVDRRDAEPVPRGILTDRDLAVEVLAVGADPDALTVEDVMTRQPITCSENDSLYETIDIMRVRCVRRLPVVGARGQLTGLVSVNDLNSALGTCLRELAQVPARGTAREAERLA
jgi:CBS domain-containing protein